MFFNFYQLEKELVEVEAGGDHCVKHFAGEESQQHSSAQSPLEEALDTITRARHHTTDCARELSILIRYHLIFITTQGSCGQVPRFSDEETQAQSV